MAALAPNFIATTAAAKSLENGVALKDILVHVDRTDGSSDRFELAVDLAFRHGSRLIALYPLEWSEDQLDERRTAELGLISAKALDRMVQREERSINQTAERVRLAIEALGRQRGVEIEWRCISGPAADLLPQYARYADLCIIGHHPVGDLAPNEYSLSEKLLFVSGRPVLFVPPAERLATLGRHIAVAWNSSRPAARAVNDAMPLFEGAERTTVITVNATDYIDRNRALPAAELVQHLRRHGAACDLVELENIAASSIADELQSNARTLGADLLVAGAFGQPKLWEKLFGGVTRTLLDRMTLPILMSF